MTTYIYTLSDPRCGQVRYIGRTIAPESRLYAHKTGNDRTPKADWVSELMALGLHPVMEIIDSSEDKVTGREKEQYWMNHYKANGNELLNQTGAFNSNFLFKIPLPQFKKLSALADAHGMDFNEVVCHLINKAELPPPA